MCWARRLEVTTTSSAPSLRPPAAFNRAGVAAATCGAGLPGVVDGAGPVGAVDAGCAIAVDGMAAASAHAAVPERSK